MRSGPALPARLAPGCCCRAVRGGGADRLALVLRIPPRLRRVPRVGEGRRPVVVWIGREVPAIGLGISRTHGLAPSPDTSTESARTRPFPRRPGIARAATLRVSDVNTASKAQRARWRPLMTEKEDFTHVLSQYRTELFAHCYRMAGSIHDAEDLVQETLLRAWRSYGTFEGRASVRTWLYRIATNVCLSALEHRDRRLLPTGLGTPHADPEAPLATSMTEVPWIQPVPSALLGAPADDPAAVVVHRASCRLALIAALQWLPPRQRAVLLLRDVLAMSAGEVADLLGTSVPAVKSALQRARAQLQRLAPVEDDVTDTVTPDQQHLLERYMRAFEDTDVHALLELLTKDAVAEMPPLPCWFTGREAIVRFFGTHVLTTRGRYRLVPTSANGQPAFALYRRGSDGLHHGHSVTVLTLAGHKISRISGFLDADLLDSFGLARTYGAQRSRRVPV
ncbi:sigma-70 family RNA polymerase sigma factor [Streptomyces sp. bgisy060]